MSGFVIDLPSPPAATSAPPEKESDAAAPPHGDPAVLLLPDAGAPAMALEEELSVFLGECEGGAQLPTVQFLSVDFTSAEAPGVGQSAALLSALRRKEKELLVAARLGKALLERNRELSDQSERRNRELSETLEQMEQQKHGLRWQLESREGEWESRVSELEMDVRQLQGDVEGQQARIQELEQEKNQAIAELSEQNQKLLEQLSRATEAEQLLSTQVQSLREEFRKKNISASQHMTHLENLQAEMQILSKRKKELERHMSTILAKNEILQATAEGLQERTLMLEKQCHEKDLQLRQSQLDLRDMRASHERLNSHLEELRKEEDLLELDTHACSLLYEIEQEEEEEREQLRLQLWEAQCQVHSLCCKLRGSDSEDCTLPSETSSPKEVLRGSLRDSLRELCRQVQNLVDMGPASGEDTTLEDDVHKLSQELQAVKELYSKEQEKARTRQQEALQLQNQVTFLSVELRSAREKSESLRALAGVQEPGEQLLSAMRDRDDAIAKKNLMEMELAKCKIDIMSLNCQLLDAIHQKLQLSQQLEAWQDDMVRVINQQLMDKHQEECLATPYSFSGCSGRQGVAPAMSSTGPRCYANKDKKLFSFFKNS